MSIVLAAWIAALAAGYLGIGVLFAIPFAFRWAGRVDPSAREGSWGFRVLIIPGAALLWPVLLTRLARSRSPE